MLQPRGVHIPRTCSELWQRTAGLGSAYLAVGSESTAPLCRV
jgi:hypothetical protein